MDSILCEIWEYDLNTSALRFVLSTGTVETSFPRGIVIYPYENNGSVYSVHCVSIFSTLYQYTLYIVLVYSVHCISILCTLYQYTLYIVLVYSVHCISILCTLCQYTCSFGQYTLYIVFSVCGQYTLWGSISIHSLYKSCF